MAATTCLYVGIAILVFCYARGWWRYLFLIPAIVMPVLIAIARMYRGEHHPTDILASVLFAALWLTAATLLIKPGRDGSDRADRGPLGLPRRKGGRPDAIIPGSRRATAEAPTYSRPDH
jgi:undecaprenyl-diphosphatase